MYLAYTYFIKNKITNQFYYGSRGANIKLKRTPQEDFWIHYFTSSKVVKQLIKEYGTESFEFNILMEDYDYNKCFWYEQDLIKADIKNLMCLNKHYTDEILNRQIFSMLGKSRSKEANKKSSISLLKYRETEDILLREEIIKKQKNTWKNRSKIKEEERVNEMLKSRNNKTPEEFLLMTENRRNSQNNRSETDKLLAVTRQKSTKCKWSADRKEEIKNKIRESVIKGNKNSKRYIISNPNGDTFTIVNLREFCKNNNLSYSGMAGIARGTQQKCNNHPGWSASLDILN